MTASDLNKMQSTSSTFGESLAEPFFFISQVHNTINTIKADRLAAYSEVTVDVYLGKGDHFLFDCATGFNAELSGYTAGTVTDFCSSIPTLQSVYTSLDTISYNFQPLKCSMLPALLELPAPLEESVFLAKCHDTEEKPVVYQVDDHAFFNVTNSLTVTGIAFDGTSLQARYTDVDNLGRSVREFPVKLCSWSTDTFATATTNPPINYLCL
jgi:hypothetical protein